MNATDIKIIEPSVTVLTSAAELRHQLHLCELAGRVCYDSTDKLIDDVSDKFLTRIIESHHESVLEHAHMSVIFTTDRAVSHQLVRHRLCSFSQQSQRYCRYSSPDDPGRHKLMFVLPAWAKKADFAAETELSSALLTAADAYEDLLATGCRPEEARAVLPNCTATTICVTANIREWRHIFAERLAAAAQLDIKLLMYSLYRTLIANGFSFILDGINVDPHIEDLVAKYGEPECVMPGVESYPPASYKKPQD